MLQLNTLKQPHNTVSHLKMIRSLTIDVNKHDGENIHGRVKTLNAHVSDIYDLTRYLQLITYD